MSAQQIISQNYSLIQSQATTNSQKAELYYVNIFIKYAENDRDLYIDIKNFLQYYILSVNEKNYGYDSVNAQKIFSCIDLLANEQKLGILKFLKTLLGKFHLSEEWNEYEKQFYSIKNSLIKEGRIWYLNPILILRFLFNKCIYSIWYLLLCIVLIIVLDFVILLPNEYNWPSFFKVTYQDISTVFWVNHFANVLLGLFEIESSFKIEPLNLVGVVLLIFGKIFKILFLIKYLIDLLLKKISINA